MPPPGQSVELDVEQRGVLPCELGVLGGVMTGGVVTGAGCVTLAGGGFDINALTVIVGSLRTERSAVGVRRFDHAKPCGAVFGGVAVGRELPHQRRVAVIGAFGHDDAVRARDRAGDFDGEVVGLGAGAHEVAHAEVARERRAQPFGEPDDVVVEVAGVGVEKARLRADRLDHSGVAMADRCNVVVAVEQAVAVGVVQPNALAAHEMDRVVVEELVRRCERRGATALKLGVVVLVLHGVVGRS